MFAKIFIIFLALAFALTVHIASAQQLEQVTLTVATAGNGTGYVVSNPAGISCGHIGSQCTATFKAGTPVTLTTRAINTGSFFAGWNFSQGSTTSSCQGALKECSFVLSQDSVVQATFGMADRTPYSAFVTKE